MRGQTSTCYLTCMSVCLSLCVCVCVCVCVSVWGKSCVLCLSGRVEVAACVVTVANTAGILYQYTTQPARSMPLLGGLQPSAAWWAKDVDS